MSPAAAAPPPWAPLALLPAPSKRRDAGTTPPVAPAAAAPPRWAPATCLTQTAAVYSPLPRVRWRVPPRAPPAAQREGPQPGLTRGAAATGRAAAERCPAWRPASGATACASAHTRRRESAAPRAGDAKTGQTRARGADAPSATVRVLARACVHFCAPREPLKAEGSQAPLDDTMHKRGMSYGLLVMSRGAKFRVDEWGHERPCAVEFAGFAWHLREGSKTRCTDSHTLPPSAGAVWRRPQDPAQCVPPGHGGLRGRASARRGASWAPQSCPVPTHPRRQSGCMSLSSS